MPQFNEKKPSALALLNDAKAPNFARDASGYDADIGGESRPLTTKPRKALSHAGAMAD